MSSFYLTNPENPQARPKIKSPVHYGEKLENEFLKMGMSLNGARCAVIDNKKLWVPCYQKKLSPERTANLLFTDLNKRYK